jgi:hypothetical protein
MEKVIDEALDCDPVTTLRVASILRNEDNIRTTPQVIAVRASHHSKVRGTGILRSEAQNIMKRMDEPAVQLAYQISEYGRKSIPNSLKKTWADRYIRANEYELAKYRSENRAVKSVDVVRLTDFPWTDAVTKLMNGELTQTNQTWEAIRSAGGTWEECIAVMGHMALLRNVRNFIQNGISESLWLQKLIDTAATGQQIPFRYWSAYKSISDMSSTSVNVGKVLDGIEQCMVLSLQNLPSIPGKSLTLSDNSGSAWGSAPGSYSSVPIAVIGNMMGIITSLVSDDGTLGLFGDTIDYIPIRRSMSILNQLEICSDRSKRVGRATEHGIWMALDEAINNKVFYDNIFIYSDMQAGHGGLYGNSGVSYPYMWTYNVSQPYIDVPKLITRYRELVNPDVNVFCIQTAGYEDTIIPEFYKRTYIMGGWSDNVLSFAKKMIDINNGQ